EDALDDLHYRVVLIRCQRSEGSLFVRDGNIFKQAESVPITVERTAHFFMELAERLHLIGHATETEFDCPLSQFMLADALGLTAIHVNRILRQLRERKLLTLKKGRAHIHDLSRLRKLAGYQGGYLNSRN